MPQAAPPTPRALLVSADPLVRAALRGVLSTGGWALAGEVDTLARARSAWLELPFDAVLWDAGHAPLLGEVADTPPVVALVEDASSARAVLAAGAAGVVRRAADPATVCAALSAAAHGLTVEDAAFRRRRPPPALHPPVPLDVTPREHEVLALLSEGLPTRAIAERLGISRHTVKFHINALLQKLGVERRTEAVVRAARLGLIVL